MMALAEPSAVNGSSGGGSKGPMRVLVCLGRYLPGDTDGGPIRSIANMVAHLSPYLDFYIVTADRDARDTESYPGVTPNRWHQVGKAQVFYCSSVWPGLLRRAFREASPHLVVLNSFQDALTQTALLLRRVGAFGQTPILLAPRGEFSAGAMEIKRTKKNLYRLASKLFGLHESLLWQASTPHEKLELLKAAPARRLDPNSVYVAYNITDAVVSAAAHIEKKSGSVKLAFIARMSEKKNLQFLLQLLQRIEGNVRLNLFGPVGERDLSYWEMCKLSMAQLPVNIDVQYHGALDHAAIPQVLHEHHFFVLPTRGENFCHSAVESFVHGTPVVLSDATPWTGLEQAQAGFDIPLQDREAWVASLQHCVDMDQQTYALYLGGTAEYGRRFSVEAAVTQHLAMFNAAMEHAPRNNCGREWPKTPVIDREPQ